MLPIISGRDGDRIKIEVTVDLSGSMLEAEEAVLRAVNAVGNVATAEVLKRFDADGGPIMVGGSRWYSKGKLPKVYNTPLWGGFGGASRLSACRRRQNFLPDG
jgi:hypothetical protein